MVRDLKKLDSTALILDHLSPYCNNKVDDIFVFKQKSCNQIVKRQNNYNNDAFSVFLY